MGKEDNFFVIVGALDLVSKVLVAEFMQEWCSRVNDIGRTQGARHTPILPWGQNRPKNPTHIHKHEEILSPNPTHLNNYVSRGWTKNRPSRTKNELFSSFSYQWKSVSIIFYYIFTELLRIGDKWWNIAGHVRNNMKV